MAPRKPTISHAEQLSQQLEDMECILAAGRNSLASRARREAISDVREAATALLSAPSSIGCAALIAAVHQLDELLTYEGTLRDNQQL